MREQTLARIKQYYGKILKSSRDLKTNACSCEEPLPPHLKEILNEIEEEILQKFYGCGSPIPPLLEGCRVLDLGCGTGRDVYLASKLVGPQGLVVGVDMTEEQLAVARKHLDTQMKRFGFEKPNVAFKQGYIEDLKEIGLEDDFFDVVISNCVLNLSPEKEAVFAEIFRVLKPGGELYFSDIFAGRRVPEALKDDPVLQGECLAGALYLEDLRRLLTRLGFPDFRIVRRRRVRLENPEIEKKIGMVDFYALTIRAFKLEGLEDRCEDYGQVAVYQGTIPEAPHHFLLDEKHLFLTGKPTPVCGNTALILQETRYARHFKVLGDRAVHYGLFGRIPYFDEGRETPGCC